MRILPIHKDTPDLPRNFALVAGNNYAEALRNMVRALTDPAVNVVIWNPEKPSLIAEKQAMRFATAVMDRNEETDGIWACDKNMFETQLVVRPKRAPDVTCLSNQFNKMAAYTGDRVGKRNFEQWQDRSFQLFSGIREVFAVRGASWSIRAMKANLRTDYHIDDGTGDHKVRLLHHLGGPGTYYVSDDDIASRGRSIVLRDGFDTVWMALPGSVAMIAGRETSRCAVHTEPFMPEGNDRPVRCVEVIDFTVPDKTIYEAVGVAAAAPAP